MWREPRAGRSDPAGLLFRFLEGTIARNTPVRESKASWVRTVMPIPCTDAQTFTIPGHGPVAFHTPVILSGTAKSNGYGIPRSSCLRGTCFAIFFSSMVITCAGETGGSRDEEEAVALRGGRAGRWRLSDAGPGIGGRADGKQDRYAGTRRGSWCQRRW